MRESRILLVEDNADDAELALQALRRNDVKAEIEVVADGVMALERLLDTSRPLPDLVLLDLKLPRVDGREVLRVLRADERTRALPVVMLTSSAESSDLEECYRLGANSYVRKPTDFDAFVGLIGDVGRYWLGHNCSPLRIGA